MGNEMSRGSELAYPLVYKDHQDGQWIHEGMTIREAFAMAAMQGLCANHVFFEGVGEAFEALGCARGSQENATAMRKMIAKCSLAHADALIEALKETP